MRIGFGLLLIAAVTVGCSSHKLVYHPGGEPSSEHDNQTIPAPKLADPVLAWQSLDRSVWEQGEQLLDMDRNFRKLIGRPREAYNMTRFDGVANSSWFTNRIGIDAIDPAEVERGPNDAPGPDTTGPWIVSRPKIQGFTIGFWIKDVRGDQYIMKFDPSDNPEIATAAAAMGSRYFHACGYNVPEETIVYWRPEQLQIQPGITYTDRSGNTREFTQEYLDDMLKDVYRLPDGRIRSLASRLLPGKVVGPFSYDGRRKDDPNDWCPHENRRELRGLYVIASLINHYDAKDQNTLDLYVTEGERRYVKHHLIDFGSTFGANSNRPKGPKQGYCNIFDLRDVLVSWFTLGLKKWGWEDAKPYEYKTIGYFESEIFQPNKWDVIVPNPAFENLTARDAYWGAKVVMAWREEYLRALVAAGKYSDPEAEAYLIKTLMERREKIGRYWFGRVNPLDDFTLEVSPAGPRLRFDDLAVRYNLETASATKYRWKCRTQDRAVSEWTQITETSIELNQDLIAKVAAAFAAHKSPSDRDHLVEIRIETRRSDSGWSKPALAWLWFHPETGQLELVGIEHLD